MSYINIGDFTGGKQDYWSWAHLKSFVGQDEAAEHPMLVCHLLLLLTAVLQDPLQ